MKYEKAVYDAIVEMALNNQWSRDPREGPALDCLHFDEYCESVHTLKDAIDIQLFSKAGALKAALKHYSLYVCLYTLGYSFSDVAYTEGYELVREGIAKNVNENWDRYYSKIQKSFVCYMSFLDSDSPSSHYVVTPLKQFQRNTYKAIE